MKRYAFFSAALLIAASASAQVVGGGPVIGGGGSGGSGTIGGTLAAEDNLVVRTDGTGGSTIQASALRLADTTGDLQWEGTTADAFEGNFTFADPTADWTWAWGADGQVAAPVGSASVPTYSFAGSTNTGLFSPAANQVALAAAGDQIVSANANGVVLKGYIAGDQNNSSILYSVKRPVDVSVAGSGAPNVLAATASNGVYTNEGSTAENYHTLPGASAGLYVTFVVQDADGIRITAAAGDTIRPIAGTAASATGGFIRCATQGAFITLVAINSVEWVAIGSAGVWTIDV